MRNYRIKKDKKKNEYFVEGQIYKNIWLPITDYKTGDIYFKIKNYLYFIGFFAGLSLNHFIEPNVSMLGILAVLYDIFFVIFTFIYLVELEGRFKKRYFSGILNAKKYINDKIKNERYDDHLKKTGKTEIVGVMMNGEYIDSKQLLRWKKLERIINEKDSVLK